MDLKVRRNLLAIASGGQFIAIVIHILLREPFEAVQFLILFNGLVFGSLAYTTHKEIKTKKRP